MAQNSKYDTTQTHFRDWPRAYHGLDRHERVSTAVNAFHRFFDEEFDDTEFARSAIARGIEHPESELRCVMDFVFVWLMEGCAALACPSFEEYLMAIIGITEEARYEDRVRTGLFLRTATDTADGVDITFWGERPEQDGPLAGQAAGWRSRESDRGYYINGLPAGWQGFNHPAFSRDTYEFARSADLRQVTKKH